MTRSMRRRFRKVLLASTLALLDGVFACGGLAVPAMGQEVSIESRITATPVLSLAQELNPAERAIQRDGPIETWSPEIMWTNYHEIRKVVTDQLRSLLDADLAFHNNRQNLLNPERIQLYNNLLDMMIRKSEAVISFDDNLLSLAEGGAYTPAQVRSVQEAKATIVKLLELCKTNKASIPEMLDNAKKFFQVDQEIAQKVKENPYWPIVTIAITQDQVKDTVKPIPQDKIHLSESGGLPTFEDHPPRVLADIKAGKDVWYLDNCRLGAGRISHYAIYVVFSGTTLNYIIEKNDCEIDHKASYLWSLYSLGDIDQTLCTNSKSIDHLDGRLIGTTLTVTHRRTSDFQWGTPGELGAVKRHTVELDTIVLDKNSKTWTKTFTNTTDVVFGPPLPDVKAAAVESHLDLSNVPTTVEHDSSTGSVLYLTAGDQTPAIPEVAPVERPVTRADAPPAKLVNINYLTYLIEGDDYYIAQEWTINGVQGSGGYEYKVVHISNEFKSKYVSEGGTGSPNVAVVHGTFQFAGNVRGTNKYGGSCMIESYIVPNVSIRSKVDARQNTAKAAQIKDATDNKHNYRVERIAHTLEMLNRLQDFEMDPGQCNGKLCCLIRLLSLYNEELGYSDNNTTTLQILRSNITITESNIKFLLQGWIDRLTTKSYSARRNNIEYLQKEIMGLRARSCNTWIRIIRWKPKLVTLLPMVI